MRTGILLAFLFPSFLFAASDVIERNARNVRDFGAKGDGIGDDTQAFIRALQSRRALPNGAKQPVSVYVPPGRYLLSGTLIVWGATELFGDWQNPPTLMLAPGSPDFQDVAHPAPFIVTAGGYRMPENTHDWETRTNDVNASTNNTFEIIVRDLNIEIGGHNPGAWGLYWWCAQQTSLRNVCINAGTSLGCLNTNAWGGGSTIANCKFKNGQTGYFSDATSMEFFRDCVFTGQTRFAISINGVAMYAFHHIELSETAPVQLGPGFCGVISFLQCDFHQTDRVPFIDDFHRSSVHFEDVRFASQSLLLPELKECAVNGMVNCWSSKKVTINDSPVSGSDEAVRECVAPLKLPDPEYPRPSTHCVNVRSMGAKGDGFQDDTKPLTKALMKYSELFFPSGIYLVSAPLTVRPGQRLFGATGAIIRLDAAGLDFGAKLKGFLQVQGNGRDGVSLCNLRFQNNAPDGSCLEWHGDPSSIVIDCSFLNLGGSPEPSIVIDEGGGYFEESWNPAGDRPSVVGVLIRSQKPLWLCSFQAEHYRTASIQLSGSRQVGLVNIEMESRPTSEDTFGTQIRLQDSQEVYGYSLGAGNWQKSQAADLIRLEGKNHVRLWGLIAVNVSHLVTVLDKNSNKTYGKESTGYQDIDASVLAGFVEKDN